MKFLKTYFSWIHGRWPAGHVEKLPIVDENGKVNVPGVYVAGDLRGIPLLKFSADTGAKCVTDILADANFQKEKGKNDGVLDLLIVGAGVAGMSAALEARKAGLRYEILEAGEPFSTIVNFPKGKPIYAYPKDMIPAGDLKITAAVKEPLVEELLAQTVNAGIRPIAARVESVARRGNFLEAVVPEGKNRTARRVILALGRSGNFRKLGAPGETSDKVYNRLHDPKDYAGKDVLVVGGGDSALECAIALAQCGARVTLSYRKPEFARPKPENVEKIQALLKNPAADVSVDNPVSERVTTAAGPFMEEGRTPGRLQLRMGSAVTDIRPREVLIRNSDGAEETLANDVVFSMIGREAPLDFFRRSGIRVAGEWTKGAMAAFAGFFLFCAALYDWKSGGILGHISDARGWFPGNLKFFFPVLAARPESLLGTILISASSRSFYYTLAYTLIVVIFGLKRIVKRKTPYVTLQTLTLMAIQVVPLFLLPEIILPWMGKNGWIPAGILDALFPTANYGHGREYWRSYGFILAWPLMIYNVFTDQPLKWWLIISLVQTFGVIPGMIYFWGKGAYCGWICSCGALAETLGDAHRQKMPHGPLYNRLNMIGQGILFLCFFMLALRILGWVFPDVAIFEKIFPAMRGTYKWAVDVFLGGVVGYGFYFWFSGRVWCRSLCPLAALMHIYSRFSRFRILADKKKCISCNVCTSVCHMGIDIMNFANKGLAMNDPECVRCSACVQTCPTGVLSFGQMDKSGRVIKIDALPAGPFQIPSQKT